VRVDVCWFLCWRRFGCGLEYNAHMGDTAYIMIIDSRSKGGDVYWRMVDSNILIHSSL
jgi:hypothetical protein